MASELVQGAAGKMTQLCRKVVRLDVIRRWRVFRRVAVVRNIFRFIWQRLVACSTGLPAPRYRRLTRRSCPTSLLSEAETSGSGLADMSTRRDGYESDLDLVPLKISLLGDGQIGKTSFVIKYAGDEQEKRSLQMAGLSLMDKTLVVQGAKISVTIWDVGGENKSTDHLSIACKDAVAILFMFDLTSRCTLNSVIEWYKQARKWNKTAIPILIGTKFDDFTQLPPDLQLTIATQAQAYAKAMKATLFFSSSTHNINVNKIFKFIVAKLFDLPWTLERNLTIGEPLIDF